MNNLRLASLSPEHSAIAHHLRQADLDEIALTSDLTPEAAVALSIATSDIGYAAFLDDRLCSVFGVAGNVIWLVGTEEVTRHPVAFYRVSLKIFPALSLGRDFLHNFVDARNTLSLRWLQWLGFNIEPQHNGLHLVWWKRKET